MFSNILNLFQSNTISIPNTQEKKDLSVKKLVSRYSNGNISLQKSNYITKKQLKDKQDKIFAHKFV